MKKTIYLMTIVLAAASCRNKPEPAVHEEITRVRTVPLVMGDLSIPVPAAGVLVLSEEIRLSFKTGGIIDRVNADEGSRVEKGQVLASLNLAEINSSVTQARNGYEKALRDHTRAENLYRDSVATLETKQNAATALEVAKSVLEAAEFNQKHSMITAPSDGIILKKLAKQNELVSAGYPVFLFGSAGKYLKVKAGLADRDMVRVQRGDSALVTFDAYPQVRFHGIVDMIGKMADPLTGTFETEMLIEDQGYRLASGLVANIEIFPSAKNKFIMVPVGAVIEANGKKGYVYVMEDSMTVKKISVSIEGLDGDMAALSGMPAGFDEVVVEGSSYLRDGMKVQVIK